MVVFKQFSSLQFNALSNTRARMLYDTTKNTFRWNNSNNFNNFLVSSDSNDDVTGINNLTLSGTLNISNAGVNNQGLQLNGTLVIASANQLNYNNVTPGIISASSTMVVDANRNISNLNRLNTTGNIGINTSASEFAIELNNSIGKCLRLSYNDSIAAATNKCDFLLSSTGSLTINPTGSNPSITMTANLNTIAVSTTKTNLANNTVDFPLSLTVLPNNVPNIGLGTGIEFNTTNNLYTIFNLGTFEYYSLNITDNTENASCRIRLAVNDTLATVMTLNSGGIMSCTSFIETSDIRMKENIILSDENDSSNKINKLNVKSYNYKNDIKKKRQYGLIAQEVSDIIPEVVHIVKTENLDDLHQIHYSGLVPHLINCIKDIYKKLDEIKLEKNKLEKYEMRKRYIKNKH